MPLKQSAAIEVKRIKGKGRGVFARRRIRKGEIIERVPVIVLPAEEVVGGTTLASYAFKWGRGQAALALGYGSLYNHSYRPNARYWDVGPRTKEFTALRDIEPGEEITVNYNGKPRSRASIWFEVVEATAPNARNGSDRATREADQSRQEVPVQHDSRGQFPPSHDGCSHDPGG
jgi:SET domain-containing protein